MTEIINSAIFTIKVLNIGITTVDNLTDVVKQVTWSIKASKDGVSTEEVQYDTILNPPDSSNYIPLSELTEDKVVDFIISNDPRLPGIKNYLKERVEIEIAKTTLIPAPLPWASA